MKAVTAGRAIAIAMCGVLAALSCATSGAHSVVDDGDGALPESGAPSDSAKSSSSKSDAQIVSNEASLVDDLEATSVSPPIRDVQSDFSATCGTCEAGQTCAPGYGGTYCVVPCPGQPCPDGGPQVPYCDVYGGVHCQSK